MAMPCQMTNAKLNSKCHVIPYSVRVRKVWIKNGWTIFWQGLKMPCYAMTFAKGHAIPYHIMFRKHVLKVRNSGAAQLPDLALPIGSLARAAQYHIILCHVIARKHVLKVGQY